MKKRRPVRISTRVAVVGLAMAGLLGGCIETGVDSYSEFRSAVEGGASCTELFDQRRNFDAERDLERIDRDLERIGCDNEGSERNDR